MSDEHRLRDRRAAKSLERLPAHGAAHAPAAALVIPGFRLGFNTTDSVGDDRACAIGMDASAFQAKTGLIHRRRRQTEHASRQLRVLSHTRESCRPQELNARRCPPALRRCGSQRWDRCRASTGRRWGNGNHLDVRTALRAARHRRCSAPPPSSRVQSTEWRAPRPRTCSALRQARRPIGRHGWARTSSQQAWRSPIRPAFDTPPRPAYSASARRIPAAWTEAVARGLVMACLETVKSEGARVFGGGTKESKGLIFTESMSDSSQRPE